MSKINKYLENILLLKEIPGIKYKTIFEIVKRFDSIEKFKRTNQEELASLQIYDYDYERIIKHNFTGSVIKNQEKILADYSTCKFITIFENNYPINLKSIYQPPLFLSYEGSLDNDQDYLSISMVGARKISTHGAEVTIKLAKELSEAGFVIVSGLAMGADNCSHLGALKAKGRTVGIVGAGLEQKVVLASRKTRREMLNNGGAVISPFLLGTCATPGTFPFRNRIISGFSLGVIVTEAKKNSGSLITAYHALEQNKEIFAIPNRIFNENFEGTNLLIRKGEAKLVTCANDIIDEFPDYIKLNLRNYSKIGNNLTQRKFSDPLEQKIFEELAINSLNIDQLCDKFKTDVQDLSSKLMMMEIDGIIVCNGGYYKVKI